MTRSGLLLVCLCAAGGIARAQWAPCGDCDGDGTVSVLDALRAAQHDVGLQALVPPAFDLCDVEPPLGDRRVDVQDALVLAQVHAGLVTTLRCRQGPVPRILVNEISTGSPCFVELVNVDVAPVDLSGWQLQLAAPPAPPQVFTIPDEILLDPGGYLLVQDSPVDPGFRFECAAIGWTDVAPGEVLLRNAAGSGVDYVAFNTQVLSILPPDLRFTAAVPLALAGVGGLSRIGFTDTDQSTDFEVQATRTPRDRNVSQPLTLPSPRPFAPDPTDAGSAPPYPGGSGLELTWDLNGDFTSFRVLCDTASPPVAEAGSGLATPRLTLPALRPLTTYHWRVEAVWAQGTTVGPEWSFTTGAWPQHRIVGSLDLDRYRSHIQTLSAFGDRLQGTPGNLSAAQWIEQQLTGMGYTVERHAFTYQMQPRESLYATKVGTVYPFQMYLVSAHLDGRGGGGAADDDASGVAVVLECAWALSRPGVETDTSVRFLFWNNEETGLGGSTAYVQDRAPLQGLEDPPGSGLYPEPTWLGVIQHDMVLFDHGLPPQAQQIAAADLDVEYQAASGQAAASLLLAQALRLGAVGYATDYPAQIGTDMRNTDSWPFRNVCAAVSVRENQRIAEIGQGSNPHWHQPTDLYATYSLADFRLGFNAAQMTLGAVADLAGARSP